jgi:hypothetical protein
MVPSVSDGKIQIPNNTTQVSKTNSSMTTKGIYLNYFPISSTPCWPWESGERFMGTEELGTVIV